MGMAWRVVALVGLWAGFLSVRSCISYRQLGLKVMETPAEFTARFNAWLAQANAPVQAGHDAASESVQLEEGEEWGCEWEMDFREVNAAARKAVEGTDLLGTELKQHWLAVLDSATRKGTVYGVGTLVVMGRYDVDGWGTDVGAFYLVEEPATDEPAATGILTADWSLEPICAGYSMGGRIHVELHRTASGRLELVGVRFEGE